jgi:hypothetical protein
MEKKILLLGEAVYMYQPEDLPPEASVEREIFIREGVKSILIVSISRARRSGPRSRWASFL